MATAAGHLGVGVVDVMRSVRPGTSGTIEYFLWLQHIAGGLDLSTVLDRLASADPADPALRPPAAPGRDPARPGVHHRADQRLPPARHQCRDLPALTSSPYHA